jgi:hypothetical protein
MTGDIAFPGPREGAKQQHSCEVYHTCGQPEVPHADNCFGMQAFVQGKNSQRAMLRWSGVHGLSTVPTTIPLFCFGEGMHIPWGEGIHTQRHKMGS